MTTTGWVAVVVGLILIVWPGTGVVTIAWLIGIVALLLGVSLIWLALPSSASRREWTYSPGSADEQIAGARYTSLMWYTPGRLARSRD